MPATYFRRDGSGHSIRGRHARDAGATAWSRLPVALRRGLKSADAQLLGISAEWHHAGKHASEVYVYYPQQVEAFWSALDHAGLSVPDAITAARREWLFAPPTPERATWYDRWCQLVDARDAAEAVRADLKETV